ncbi:MAG: HAMP domain-containing histidine kinase [Lachnospiraceae bacterium]|nr:HAMP domain-containing histidine kinase [Lachnospiraceae bacterium]
MWIRKKDVEQLSEFVKGYISGEKLDIRVNREGVFNILKNDIYSLVDKKNEQIKAIESERDILSDYMADISHQLKTPITSMMIMADLLEDAEPEKQAEFIHNIQFSLNKMEWLVEALLKMAKLDAHAIDFIKKDIHTSELLEAVKPSVAILLDINNQATELKNDCAIHCDKRWTVEALTNIIKNAIEYSPKDSVIVVDSGENPMYSWISVKDSGMGMDRTKYAALFKRFENSTSENGFGIGMPLALSIMKGQGGDIDVDFGGNGEGTTFILKFFK